LLGLANLRSLRLRAISAVYAVFAFCWLLLGIIQVYPMFAYYGYETIGDWWMGENSRDYAGVVVVKNDGSTEAIEWLGRNVSTGSTVVIFLDDIHIINYLDSIQPFAFELVHAGRSIPGYKPSNRRIRKGGLRRCRPVDRIDFAVPLTDSLFGQYFRTEPVYQVFRGRGVYEMPVMQIYYKGRE
jgi:hypothetical protein